MDDAFDLFYQDTNRRLIRFAYGLSGDPLEAQDLVQEAYTRA
jgi:RNA polymerase sigma-70 factor (ECF subfamily)